jgi:putative ATP-binding cassette transporter
LYRQYLQQIVSMRWRTWLTERLLAHWLQRGTAFRLAHADGPGIDNPDQRIADDARLFVESCLDLSLGLLNACVTLCSFVAILWRLSGTVMLPLGAASLPLPGMMVWVALLYAGLGSWITQRLGRPLVGISASARRQRPISAMRSCRCATMRRRSRWPAAKRPSGDACVRASAPCRSTGAASSASPSG